eukprot:COSAG05_NODE_715_length_7805_cov_5.098235_4_plen_90_part_00
MLASLHDRVVNGLPRVRQWVWAYRFAQVSSLQSQILSLKSLWNAQVSSLKSQVLVSFFHFFPISWQVYLRLQYESGGNVVVDDEAKVEP